MESKIRDYIADTIHHIENETYVDDLAIDDIESHIYNKYTKESTYINKLVINHLERHRTNIRSKVNLSDKQIDKMVTYLNDVVNNEKHELHIPIKIAIQENVISFGFSEDIDTLLSIASLIQTIIIYSHILDLVHEDEKKNLLIKRDRKKIEDAINLIKNYSTDTQVQFYLDSILLPQNTISHETVLRSLFHNMMMVFQNLNFSAKDSSSYSHNILCHVFNTTEQYRTSPRTQSTNYKNFKLTQYKR